MSEKTSETVLNGSSMYRWWTRTVKARDSWYCIDGNGKAATALASVENYIAFGFCI